MVHLIQLLIKLLLQVEGELPDNSRLVGSIFIAGLWSILIAELFPKQLGPWRDGFLWGGWICVGIATFLLLRRKIWEWRGKPARRTHSAILK